MNKSLNLFSVRVARFADDILPVVIRQSLQELRMPHYNGMNAVALRQVVLWKCINGSFPKGNRLPSPCMFKSAPEETREVVELVKRRTPGRRRALHDQDRVLGRGGRFGVV